MIHPQDVTASLFISGLGLGLALLSLGLAIGNAFVPHETVCGKNQEKVLINSREEGQFVVYNVACIQKL